MKKGDTNQNQTDTTDARVPNYRSFKSITSNALLKYPAFGVCLRECMYIIDDALILDNLTRILNELKANLSETDANKLDPSLNFDSLLVNIKEVFANYVEFQKWTGTDLDLYFSCSVLKITEHGKEHTDIVEKVAQAIYFAAFKGGKVTSKTAMAIITQVLMQCTFIIQEDKNDRLSSIEKSVSGLEDKVSGLENSVSGLKTEVSGLKTEVSGLITEVSNIRQDLSGLLEKFQDMLDKKFQDMLDKKFDTRNDEIDQIEQDVTILKEYCVSTAKANKALIENVSNITNAADKLIES